MRGSPKQGCPASRLEREMRRIRIPDNLRKQDRDERFWHLHAHSRFSAKDALSTVGEMVQVAAGHQQPALALTDHGNMAGSIQLYKHAKKHGIAPFPGVEAYLKIDASDKKAQRYHIGLVAFTTDGYEHLVKLSSRSHTRDRFHHKPHVDFSDFAEWSQRGWTQGIALTTGCFFGIVQQTLVNQGEQSAMHLIGALAKWFPSTYVELQHHNIYDQGHDDDQIVRALHDIAGRMGLPVVITQDAHYCHPEEKKAHETLKLLSSWSDDPSEAKFPGDSFHLADSEFVKSHYPANIWEDGLDGLSNLLGKHSLVIPELETYTYKVPRVTHGDPLEELNDLCIERMNSLGIGSKRYWSRFYEEVEVVTETGMAGYLMLNKQICDWMRSNKIIYQARGSASGSLVCYLLDITQEDPIKGGLRYERFLSKDRTKPPDIDLDVEDSRRGEVLEMLAARFASCQIGTWSINSMDPETGRGSLFVDYLSTLRKGGASNAHLATLKSADDLPVDVKDELTELSGKKTYKSYGTHAGGLVITSSQEEFDRLVPTMLVASSDTRVTQYDMDDVEDLGLLKEDILGQISLTTIRRCVELIGEEIVVGNEWLPWIPMNDKQTFAEIRKQNVTGVFQLEGWTNKQGCREVRPKNLRDLIHLISIYRPATIDTGLKDVYVERKSGWQKTPDRHPILMKHMKETYGVPVFQDQVIAVLREIGFKPEDLTSFLKAVKASNENIGNAAEVIAGYASMFETLARACGFEQEDLDFTWGAIEGFAKYGFNKAHATAYGRRSYWMAYLKTHYPLEFHTSLLQTWAGKPKERDYILATKEAGIRLLGPDVNVSGSTWSIDRKRGAIRKGLVSIKGIGDKAAEEIARNAPYTDMQDLIDKCDGRAVTGGKSYARQGTVNGVLGKLSEAGALRSISG